MKNLPTTNNENAARLEGDLPEIQRIAAAMSQKRLDTKQQVERALQRVELAARRQYEREVPKQVENWTACVTHNACNDILRKDLRWNRRHVSMEKVGATLSSGGDPREALEKREVLGVAHKIGLALLASKDELSGTERKLWELRNVRNLKRLEIAEELGVPTENESKAQRTVSKMWAAVLKNLWARMRVKLARDPAVLELLGERLKSREGGTWLAKLLHELKEEGILRAGSGDPRPDPDRDPDPVRESRAREETQTGAGTGPGAGRQSERAREGAGHGAEAAAGQKRKRAPHKRARGRRAPVLSVLSTVRERVQCSLPHSSNSLLAAA